MVMPSYAPLGRPLEIVSQTLNGFPLRPLSETLRNAIRAARLTEDYYTVWWLTREALDFDDKAANDTLAFEMVRIFSEADYNAHNQQISLELGERRTLWASTEEADLDRPSDESAA